MNFLNPIMHRYSQFVEFTCVNITWTAFWYAAFQNEPFFRLDQYVPSLLFEYFFEIWFSAVWKYASWIRIFSYISDKISIHRYRCGPIMEGKYCIISKTILAQENVNLLKHKNSFYLFNVFRKFGIYRTYFVCCRIFLFQVYENEVLHILFKTSTDCPIRGLKLWMCISFAILSCQSTDRLTSDINVGSYTIQNRFHIWLCFPRNTTKIDEEDARMQESMPTAQLTEDKLI